MRIRAIKIGFVTAVASAALWGGSGIAVAGGGATPPSDRTAAATRSRSGPLLRLDRALRRAGHGRHVDEPGLMTHDIVGVGDTWGDPGPRAHRRQRQLPVR